MIFFYIFACTSGKNGEDSAQSVETNAFEPLYNWQEQSVFDKGPFNVGHMQVQRSYTPLDDQEDRVISMEIWYPTEENSGEAAEYYLGIDEQSFSDAPAAQPIHSKGYPVYLSSHGYRGWGANSPFLMRHFASHGWVVIAPDHINNTIVDHSSPLPVNHFVHRPMDLSQALDLLEELSDQNVLAGTINTEEVAMGGHSFGASYSTWAIAGASYDNIDAVCMEGQGLENPDERCSESEYAALSSGELGDERVVAAIPHAGSIRESFFGEEGYKAVSVPVMFISGTDDNQESNQEHFDTVEGIDFRWLSIEGACHTSFTGGGCPNIESEKGFAILNAYILAFARTHVLGDDSADLSALLDGSNLAFPEASIQKK